MEIIGVAERRRVPIIADEIYGEMTFEGCDFFPIADLAQARIE